MKPSILIDDCSRGTLNASPFLRNSSLRFWYGKDNVSPWDSSSPLHDTQAAESSSAILLTSTPSLEPVRVARELGNRCTSFIWRH